MQAIKLTASVSLILLRQLEYDLDGNKQAATISGIGDQVKSFCHYVTAICFHNTYTNQL